MTLTDEQLAEAKEVFALFDVQGNGRISANRLGDVLRALRNNPTQRQVADAISQVDPNGQGWVDFDTILNLIVSNPEAINVKASKEDILQGFQVFDKDGNGTIAAAELRYVLTNLGEKLTDTEVDELFAAVEINKDGNIRYEDFVNLVMSA